MSTSNILIIKHGALGDIILATAGFAAIRAQHPAATIVLLTTKPYAELLAKSPYFQEIWVDAKPKWHDRKAIGRLRAMLNSKRWEWVYDLQGSTRATLYQWLLKHPWPKISNASRWASHPYGRYDTQRHALENLHTQLKITGIPHIGLPDLSWLTDTEGTAPLAAEFESAPFALLIPGGSAHRPEKRWPAEHYASLARELVGRGITPVLIGTDAENDVLDAIAARVPECIHLGGKTSIARIASLARAARFAVGNDTGPMHVIAASGCNSLVLFSAASDPVRSAPIGPSVQALREHTLSELSVDRVIATLIV